MFYYKFGIEKVNLVLKIEVFGIKSLSKSGNPDHLSRASGLISHLTVDEGGCVSVPVCIVRLVPCDCYLCFSSKSSLL